MRVISAMVAATAFAMSLDCAAQEASTPIRMSREEAEIYMSAYLGNHPRTDPCPVGAWVVRHVESFQISEAGVTLHCSGGRTNTIAFQDAPDTLIAPGRVLVGRASPARWIASFFDVDDPQRLVAAWAGLQSPPAPRDPLTDIAFQDALRRAASDPIDRSEESRRTQVQVEALIAANRVEAALTAYRDALDVSPGWAAGHYNAALVAGQLEQYGLAITEMRRYLYLAPNAPDARAAQDQIYRWEALLAQP